MGRALETALDRVRAHGHTTAGLGDCTDSPGASPFDTRKAPSGSKGPFSRTPLPWWEGRFILPRCSILPIAYGPAIRIASTRRRLRGRERRDMNCAEIDCGYKRQPTRILTFVNIET